MPFLTDEDVGLGSSYLTDEDVGLGGDEQGGDETWSPEEQARLEAEEADIAPATGFKAGLSRLRASEAGRALFGPTDVEREAGAMSTGSPGEIAGAALKFMTVPPQLANPIRAATDPVIRAVAPYAGAIPGMAPFIGASPETVSGVLEGVREVGLTIPGPSFAAAPRLAMAAFSAQTIADLPDAKRAYEDALERGDNKTAAMIATQTVGNTAMLGLGAASLGPRRFTPPERGGIPDPRLTTGSSTIPKVVGDIAIPDRISAIDAQLGKIEQESGRRLDVEGEPQRKFSGQEEGLLKLRDELSAQQENGQAQQGRPSTPEIGDDAQGAAQRFTDRMSTVSERGDRRTPQERLQNQQDKDVFSKTIAVGDEIRVESDIENPSGTVEKRVRIYRIRNDDGTRMAVPVDSTQPAQSVEAAAGSHFFNEIGQEIINGKAVKNKISITKREPTKGELNAIQEPGRTAVQPKEGNAPQEPGVLLDRSKWTKATDTENLKAATPEQRIVAAQKPLDVESFTTTDADGYKAVDHGKLRSAVEGGHITSGNAATDALILHLLKPDPNHPLESIRMLDHTPEAAQLLTGTEAPFHGRWSKRGNNRAAMVEMVMKMQRGQPISSAEFMIVLGHELGHNAITSKFRDAPPEIQRDVTDLFTFVKEKGKGTAFESHNALTNAHELFAELSDPKFREWLSTLDYSGSIRQVDVGIARVPAIAPRSVRNSALGRIYGIMKEMLKLPDFITDAFGNKVDAITALDQMMSLSSRLEKVKRSGDEAGANLSKAKDFQSAIKDTEKVTNEELLARKGGATGFMWELGAKAKTAEDVAALKSMAEESAAKISSLAKEGKIEEAMALAGRQPAEAYEFATGVKISGEPKWPTFEKRSPGYVPPVPDAKYLAAKGGAANQPAQTTYYAAGTTGANRGGVQYVSETHEGASHFAEGGKHGRPGATVRPLTAALKVFEAGKATPEQAAQILGKARQFVEPDGNPNFYGVENEPALFARVKAAGFDAIRVSEGEGATSIAVLDPKQLAAKPAEAPKTNELLTKDKLVVGEADPVSSKTSPSQKWIGATETTPETGIGGQMLAGIPNPAAVYRGIQKAVKDYGPDVKRSWKVVSDAVRDIYKENLNIRKMNDLDRSVLNWSGKEQRSFGESTSAGKDIESALTQTAEKQMGGSVFTRLAEDMATGGRKPNQKQMVEVADDALSNWLEAGGGRKSANDIENALVFRRNAATDPKLKAGYEAALHLSPAEQALALDGRTVYDQLWDRAERWGLVDKDPTKPSAFRDDYVTHLWNLGKGTFAGGARTLKDQFKFAKARTFENFFEGEQAGFKPKTKRLSQLLPVYIHEMNSVIAAKQLVKQMWGGKASDGSPLLATRGIAQAVNGAKGEAVLVRPEAPSPDSAKKGLDISKYKELPGHSALHDWVFAGKDTAGNPIFEKSDLVLHPEAYKKLKAILGKSKIRNWYETKTTATMEIPKAIAKGLDVAQQETKRTMLGMLSPFHQVQEGTHAVGHRVNPFWGVPKPNMENPVHLNLAKKGLMILPDRASERNFTEGLRPSGLVSKIPGIGPLADHYSNYLFHEYIPGLKIKTALAIIERNKKVYEKQLASGEVSLEDVELLSTTQSNAAFGHMNYADLGRDPTIQHILQLGLLAPDFLEARTRFTGQGLKGVTGAKVGREQLLALATLAVGQAALAFTMAKITDGEWDGKHPFEFRKNNRRYTLRSVPEDLERLFSDTRAFLYNRINPITAKVPWQLATGRDWRGQKTTAGETLKEAAQAPIPLTARGFMGIDKSPLEDWEQLAGAVGLKIMRYSPQNEVHKLFIDWKKKSEDPKLVAQAEQAEAQTFAPSDYSDLRQAMERDNFQLGAKAYEKLLETHSAKEIKRAMNPLSVDESTGAVRDRMLPEKLEKRFLESLKDDEREVYEAAKRQRRLLYQRFQKMLAE